MRQGVRIDNLGGYLKVLQVKFDRTMGESLIATVKIGPMVKLSVRKLDQNDQVKLKVSKTCIKAKFI